MRKNVQQFEEHMIKYNQKIFRNIIFTDRKYNFYYMELFEFSKNAICQILD